LKRDGKTAKEILLIGSGFQAYVDNLFWFLPFSSTKQAYDMLVKKEMTDDNWIIKRAEIADEHLIERAPQDLSDGWKAWLAKNMLGKDCAKAARTAVPAAGPVSMVREDE
jgi:hypothetical protein